MKITKEEWERKKEHGYTHFIDGKPYILTLEKCGTVLAPVEIVSENKDDKK